MNAPVMTTAMDIHKEQIRITQNDFRCTVMPCGHNCGVMLMLECGVPKINHFHIRVLHSSLISFLCNNKDKTVLQLFNILQLAYTKDAIQQ